ncbi:MAG: disulfide bond formation protein B, partial [Parvibaculales bacterium]
MNKLSLQNHIALLGVAGLVVISAALASQYIGGLVPCDLCLKQRWPYYVALPLCLLGYLYAPHGAGG